MGRSKSKKSDFSPSGCTAVDPNVNCKGKRTMTDVITTDVNSPANDPASNGVPKAKRAKLMEKKKSFKDNEAEEDPIVDDSEDDVDVSGSDDECDYDDDDEDNESSGEDEDEDVDESEDEDEDDSNNDAIKDVTELTPVVKKGSIPSKLAQPTTPKASGEHQAAFKNFVIIANPPSDEAKLHSCLLKQGINASSARRAIFNVALIEADEEKARDLASKQLSYDGNPLHVAHLRGVRSTVDHLLHGDVTRTLFLTGLPKDLALETITAQLQSNCRPSSSKLLTQGPKNKFSNAAFLSFNSTLESTAALHAISAMRFGKSGLRVVFAKDQKQDNQHIHQLRNNTSTLMAIQLPKGTTDSQLRKLIKTGSRFEIEQRKNETVCFIEFADPSAAAAAFDEHNSQHFGQSKLLLRFVPTRPKTSNISLFVSNFESGTNPKKVEGLFPGAISSELSRGSIVINFPSIEVRRRAASGHKSLGGKILSLSCPGGIDGKVALVNNVPFTASKDDLMELLPDVESVEMHQKPDGSPQGNATAYFKSAQACQKAVTQSFSLGGRNLRIHLKKLPCFSDIKNAEHKQTCTPSTEKSKESQKLVKEAQIHDMKQVGSSSEDADSTDDDDDQADSESQSLEGDEEMVTADVDDEESSEDDDNGDESEADESGSAADSDVEMPLVKTGKVNVKDPNSRSHADGKILSPGKNRGGFKKFDEGDRKSKRGSFRGDRGSFRGDRGSFRGDRGSFRGSRGDGGFRGRGGFRGGRGARGRESNNFRGSGNHGRGGNNFRGKR